MGVEWKGGLPGDVVLRHRYGLTLPWDGLGVLGVRLVYVELGILQQSPCSPHMVPLLVSLWAGAPASPSVESICRTIFLSLAGMLFNDRHPTEQVGLLMCALQIPSLVLVQETLLVFLLLLIFCLPPHNKRSSDYL